MHTLNIIVDDIQKWTEPSYDLYKNSLDNILDNNINDIMAKIVYTKSKLLK